MFNIDFIADEDLILQAKINNAAYYDLVYQRFVKYCFKVIHGVCEGMNFYSLSSSDFYELIHLALTSAIDEYYFGVIPFRIFLGKILTRSTIAKIKSFMNIPLTNYLSVDIEIPSSDFEYIQFKDSALFEDENENIIKNYNDQESINTIFKTIDQMNNSELIKYIFELKIYGYSYKEIAIITGKSEKTVRNIVYEARKKLPNI